jgi:hypothetical protein
MREKKCKGLPLYLWKFVVSLILMLSNSVKSSSSLTRTILKLSSSYYLIPYSTLNGGLHGGLFGIGLLRSHPSSPLHSAGIILPATYSAGTERYGLILATAYSVHCGHRRDLGTGHFRSLVTYGLSSLSASDSDHIGGPRKLLTPLNPTRNYFHRVNCGF